MEIETFLLDIEANKNAKILIMKGNPEGNAFLSGGYFNVPYYIIIPSEIRKDLDLMDIAGKK